MCFVVPCLGFLVGVGVLQARFQWLSCLLVCNCSFLIKSCFLSKKKEEEKKQKVEMLNLNLATSQLVQQNGYLWHIRFITFADGCFLRGEIFLCMLNSV